MLVSKDAISHLGLNRKEIKPMVFLFCVFFPSFLMGVGRNEILVIVCCSLFLGN